MEDFVTYEQAIKLKELGFDWPTIHYYDVETHEFSPKISYNHTVCYDNWNQYNNMISAPILSQMQKWLREVKEIDVVAIPTFGEYGKKKYRYQITIYKEDFGNEDESTTIYTYEEALSLGIDKSLEILENDK